MRRPTRSDPKAGHMDLRLVVRALGIVGLANVQQLDLPAASRRLGASRPRRHGSPARARRRRHLQAPNSPCRRIGRIQHRSAQRRRHRRLRRSPGSGLERTLFLHFARSSGVVVDDFEGRLFEALAAAHVFMVAGSSTTSRPGLVADRTGQQPVLVERLGCFGGASATLIGQLLEQRPHSPPGLPTIW
jgi:hypothetical protein